MVIFFHMIVAPLKTKIMLYVHSIIFEFSDARVLMCVLSIFSTGLYAVLDDMFDVL